MFHGQPFIFQLAQGVDADAQVVFGIFSGDFLVAGCCFDAFGDHGLVGHKEECARWDFVGEAGDENRRGLHVDAHATDTAQITFQSDVMFPDAAVCGVNCARPIIAAVVADGGRNSFLQAERGQCGNFGWKVVVGSSFASNGRDGKDKVAEFIFLFESTAFAKEEDGFGFDRADEVHDGGGAGTAHAEVDNGDAAGSSVGHRTIHAAHFGFEALGEHVDVIAEVNEENVFAELVDGRAGVAREPVVYDFRFGSHTFPESNSRDR